MEQSRAQRRITGGLNTGDRTSPMSFEDCARKFRLCAAFAAKSASKPLAPEDVDAVIDQVRNLEELDDIPGLVALLA
jgi:hypothetical protein